MSDAGRIATGDKAVGGRGTRWSTTGWRDVALLGLVSFIAEISGEMMSAVLPFILVTQGATGLAIGLVDGVTEGVGDFFKYVGGALGQRAKRSRLLIGAGYLVAAASRFGVAAAPTWPVTLAARSADRVGKGLRTAPRDAMLAGFVPAAARGRAFGLHLASDASGGVIAVLLVIVLMGLADAEPQTLVLVAAVIGLFAILPLFWVRESSLAIEEDPRSTAAAPEYSVFLLVASLFAAGRVSYLFYVVRATGELGRDGALALYCGFVVLAAASAWVWGHLGDRWGKRRTLALGYLLSAGAAAAMLLDPGLPALAIAFGVLGLATGCVDGVSRALAAQVSGTTGRVARLGEYHALTGFAGLLGGIAMGLLWDNVTPQAAFAWGAVVPLLAVLGLMGLRWRHPHSWRKAPHPVLPD